MREYKELFNRALANPASVNTADYEELLSRFPYSRALHIAAFSGGQWDSQGTRGLQNVNSAPPGLFTHRAWDGALQEESTGGGTSEKQRQTYPQAQKESLAQKEPPAQNDPEQVADVSVYHDVHMPYSFLWWLNKTRMDFAHTYKPYASASAESRNEVDAGGLLDQQIRENIFHLLEPEKKLSPGPRSRQHTADIPFQVPKRTDPIIDRFIQEDPKISPPRPEKLSFENKARKSASDQATVVTETLAKIYAEQGLYPKAVEVYEKLSLKYPEKSGYFADRIDELKKNYI